MNDHPQVEQQWVDCFHAVRNDIDREGSECLNMHRDAAIQRFQDLGIPDTSVENYAYTDLKKLFSAQSFFPGVTPSDARVEQLSCILTDEQVRKIFVVNGRYVPAEGDASDWICLASGLCYGSMRAAQKHAPEILQAFFNRQAQATSDAMVHLNTAFAQDGFFMFVPEGVQEEKHIQITQIVDEIGDRMQITRNFIYLQQGATVRLTHCFHAFQEGSCCSNTVTECFLEPQSELRLLNMQSEHDESVHINSWLVEQASRSKYYSIWMGLYGGTIRTNLITKLKGENCESNAYGLFFANDHQLIDYYSTLEHLGPNSTSEQVFKSIVGEEAVGVFSGKIEVAQDAQKTAAAQTSRNILLSPRAMVHAKPHLEIYADDVKCSHGATVGQVNEDALFYLRTRGIGLDEAKFLQLFGFANEIVEKILIVPLKLQVAAQVNRRLRNKQPNRCDHCRSHCC